MRDTVLKVDTIVQLREETKMTDADVIAGLGAKLDELELTHDEHALLTDLLARNNDEAEVAGYSDSFTALISDVYQTGVPRSSGPGRPMFRAQ